MRTESSATKLGVYLFLAVGTFFILTADAPASISNTYINDGSQNKAAAIREAYGKFPLTFEANQGQTDSHVKFLSRGPGYALFLTPTEAVLEFKSRDGHSTNQASVLPISFGRNDVAPQSVLRIRLEHANSNAKASGIDELPGKSNYFIGDDTTKWRHDVPTFSKVKYQGVYPGVDLVYYGNPRQLEYDFDLAAGADPNQIELDFASADSSRIDASGNLVVSILGHEIVEPRPAIYQEVDGARHLIAGGYERRSGHTVGFKLAAYDRHQPLTIDPSLVYSTYLGGSGDDAGAGIAVDSSGNAYIVGITFSTDFPTTAGALQTTFGTKDVPKADGDVFVSKLNSDGSALVYSTYLGGSNRDEGNAITVDSSGDASITGDTYSSDFPTTTGAFQTTLDGGEDAFIAKLNSSGSALIYSTLLGGNNGDSGTGIAVDGSGNTYVTGFTSSPDFPITPGAAQPTDGGSALGNAEAFVSKLNSDGSALVYSTYLGGSGSAQTGAGDMAYGIALDSSGDAYVAGKTDSTDFPTTPGAYDRVPPPGFPAAGFVTKLNNTGSAFVYSTYLGGDATIFGVAVDSSGNAYVTGIADPGFPTTKGAFQRTLGGSSAGTSFSDAFISKLNSKGSKLVYSTYLGGSQDDRGQSIAVDSAGNAYVTGRTQSDDFPTTPDAFQTTCQSCGAAFITKLNSDGSALDYSSYLSASNEADDRGFGIAVDSTGAAYITGATGSSSFPTTPGAFQTTAGGGVGGDAFVAKFDLAGSMASFTGKLHVKVAHGEFDLESSFTVTGGSIDPIHQDVTLQIGPYSVTIPAGSFKQHGKNGDYVFKGTLNGTSLKLTINSQQNSRYQLQAQGQGANLSDIANPVIVTLSIGNVSASAQINAHIN
jgi:hypothetical protein